MTLAAGTQLGPYKVLGPIGAGGMGEVYRAKDTRLDRIVAIKVLPPHLADNSELKERLEREARTIGSLNHPHICTLYDIGYQDGTDFLVMEYLEGETLAQRLVKGPLPLEQVLQYAIEIADALDKAHRKGVTHRDLKPGNIMLTKSGTKLLDFGLAKLKQEVAPANVQLSQLPTANEPLTAQGTIVGTLQYMAPEQLEGKEVDSRTDIFAFGTVVYEMATGRRAFDGKSQASLIAKILEIDPPPISSLQPMTPPQLDRVVKKCLAKEPEGRWQDASDLCDELKWIVEGGSQTAAPAAATAGRPRQTRRWALISALACVVVAAIAGLAFWNLKPTPAPAPKPVTRTVITLPAGDRLAQNFNNPILALSSDGSHLVYAAVHGNVQKLYLRAMDSLDARAIPGTEGATNPFFSPDGEWIGFFAGGKLQKIALTGGAALRLSDAGSILGASWGRQGTIIFASSASNIHQVSDAGGASQPLTRLDKGESGHRWPQFLPDGRSMLFAGGAGTWQTAQVVVQSPKGERRNLVDGGTDPRYALSGHLLYAQAGILMAMPFDLQRLQPAGKAVPVLENVMQYGSGAAQYSISSTGSLVYILGGAQVATERLVSVSRNGTEQSLAAPSQAYGNLQLSSDGRRLAIQQEGTDLWLYDLGRETLSRFTFEATNTLPVWTPDGRRVAYASTKEGPQNIFWQLADGSSQPERLTTSEQSQVPRSFSPDGQLLAFSQLSPTTGWDIWVLRMSDRKPQLFLQTKFNEAAPSFSPDGRWLAYISDTSGRNEIYVQPYPGPGGKYEISTGGGTEPVWNPNGKELFYRSGDKMMAVNITTQPTFAAGKPRMLFEGPYVATTLTQPLYSVFPDGQRFLMLKRTEQVQAAPTQIVVVQNWFEELKQKVPVGKK